MAPAGIEISMIGSNQRGLDRALCTADDCHLRHRQAAPLHWIRRPRLESRLASQIRRHRVPAAVP